MQYIALLRGINVGGNRKVPMNKLEETFVSLGYSNVRTYINTGNVLFETNSTNFEVITHALEAKFGFTVPVIVLSIESLKHIAGAIPIEWLNNAEQKTDVLFLWPSVDYANVIEEIYTVEGIDTLHYVPGAIIWHIDKKDYNKSGMNVFIKNNIYKNVTVRNCNTVRKLVEVSNM